MRGNLLNGWTNGKNEKIIRAASVLIVVLLIVNYAVSVYNSHVITQQVKMISNHPFPVSRAASEVNVYVAQLRAQAERLQYSHAPERVDLVESIYHSVDEKIDEKLEFIINQYLTDSSEAIRLKNIYGTLHDQQTELLDLCRQEGVTDEQIDTFIKESIFPYLDEMEGKTANILAGAASKFGEFQDKANQIYMLSIAWATFLLVGILAMIILYQRLLKQKRQHEEEMSQNLRVALDSAQSANAAKSQFLSNMSHDIRTPLNAIVGMTAIAAAHLDNARRVKDCLGKISVSSRHLVGLINDILDMSKIESGKVILARETFSLPYFIQNFLMMIDPQAKARQLSFDITISNIQQEMVIGDPMRLNQILLNIVGNSIKFTSPGGAFRIKITEEPSDSNKHGHYRFIIEDTGIGMSEEFMKNIFQPFERERTSTISRTEGTGLGMAITKNLVDMMGGKIAVESEQGKGTCFTLDIPLEWAETENCDIRIERLRTLRAMVVDDDHEVCENTVQILKEIGMEGTWVDTGEAGVDAAIEAHRQARGFHTIIMDWKLPGISGIEATRRIRSALGPEVPIILLTAYDWSQFEDEAKEAGVTAFLSKPLFKTSLYQIMREVTGETTHVEKPALNCTDDFRLSGRALLAEDNSINSEIAMEILGQLGLDVEPVWDGKQAVEKIRSVPADYYKLILMDIQMPNLDGYGATEQIRNFERECGRVPVPIVAMTANAFDEDMKKAYNAGMNAYITKPVDIGEIGRTIQKFFL